MIAPFRVISGYALEAVARRRVRSRSGRLPCRTWRTCGRRAGPDKFRMCAPYSMHPMDEHVVDTMIHDVLYLDKVDDVVASLLLPLTPDT